MATAATAKQHAKAKGASSGASRKKSSIALAPQK